MIAALRELITSPVFITLLVSGVGLMLLGLIFLFTMPSDVQDRLSGYVGTAAGKEPEDPGARRERFRELRADINTALSFLSSDELRLRLSSANWQVSDREYLLLRLLAAALAFLIGWYIPRFLLSGVALGLVVYFIPPLFLYRAIEMRRQKFQEQLLDALVLIRGAVQSGYSLLQALDLIKDELKPPSGEEFGRVVREVTLGLPLGQALLNLSGRMQSDDLHMVVTAIIINSQVGGNLNTMLTAVTSTIRARIFLFGEVRALTSYARYAGYFLSFMPFVLGAIIFVINPSYFETVRTSIIAQGMLLLALVMLLLGNLLVRRIVRIKI